MWVRPSHVSGAGPPQQRRNRSAVRPATSTTGNESSHGSLHPVAATNATDFYSAKRHRQKNRRAQKLSRAGNRMRAAFVPVNCRAMVPTLVAASCSGTKWARFTARLRGAGTL